MQPSPSKVKLPKLLAGARFIVLTVKSVPVQPGKAPRPVPACAAIEMRLVVRVHVTTCFVCCMAGKLPTTRLLLVNFLKLRCILRSI